MKVDDNPPYTSILEHMSALRDAVYAARHDFKKDGKLTRLLLLKHILDGLYDRFESFAVKKGPGLARIIHAEVSGFAGLRPFQRVDSLLNQMDRAEVKASSSAAARSSGGSGRDFRFKKSFRPKSAGGRDMSSVKCYGCFKFGHIKSNCPEQKDKSS